MIKRLLAEIREYKRDALLTPLCILLEVIVLTLIPAAIAKMIDLGIEKGNMHVVYAYGTWLLVFSIIAMLFGVASGFFSARASGGFAKNLRRTLFNKVQNFSFSNMDNFKTSSLTTRLTTDITNLQNSYQIILRLAVRGPGTLIFSLIMSFMISPKLALIFLLLAPLLGIALFIILNVVHPLFVRVFKTYDRLNEIVQENLRGIRVVKSFVREDYEIEKFKMISNNIYVDFRRAERIITLNSPIMQFVMYISLLLISWFGAHMIVSSSLSIGSLVSLLTYSTQILMSLWQFSIVFIMILISRASAQRVYEVLSEESTVVNPESPVQNVKNGDISFKNVTFKYSESAEKPCIDSVTMEIKSGDVIGLMGATGSSKTSLIQLIPRLYDVSGGELLVGGVNVKEYDLTTLRNTVSVVLQKNTLFSGTIIDNLKWGDKNATQGEVERVCRIASIYDFIKSLPDGFNTMVEQGGVNFSGGQRQRLCIARALLKKPKIIIFDDSMSAVDTHTDKLIRDALKDELPEVTKIIIAQRIQSVIDADKIAVMDSGKIAAYDNHSSLLNHCAIYQEIYASQMGNGGNNAA